MDGRGPGVDAYLGVAAKEQTLIVQETNEVVSGGWGIAAREHLPGKEVERPGVLPEVLHQHRPKAGQSVRPLRTGPGIQACRSQALEGSEGRSRPARRLPEDAGGCTSAAWMSFGRGLVRKGVVNGRRSNGFGACQQPWYGQPTGPEGPGQRRRRQALACRLS